MGRPWRRANLYVSVNGDRPPLLICCLAAWWIVAEWQSRCGLNPGHLGFGPFPCWLLPPACLLSQLGLGSNVKYLPRMRLLIECQWVCWLSWDCNWNRKQNWNMAKALAFLSCGHRPRNLKIVCVFIMADKAAQISQKAKKKEKTKNKNWNHKAIKSHAAATIKMPATVGGKKHTTSWPKNKGESAAE